MCITHDIVSIFFVHISLKEQKDMIGKQQHAEEQGVDMILQQIALER